MTPGKVVEIGRAMLGVPYRRQGRDPSIALDCVGLIIAVGAAAGCSMNPPAPYRATMGVDDAIDGLLRLGLVRTDPLWTPGSVVLVRLGRASHLGIATSGGIIQANNDPGVRQVSEVPVTDQYVQTHLRAEFLYPLEER